MSQRQPYITLDSVITDYLGEAELSQHRYKKAFDLAFRGMDNMGIDFFYQVLTVALPVTSTFICVLPPNCLNVVKVGVLSGNGQVTPLKSSSNMTTYAALLPNRISNVQGNSVFDWNTSCNGGWWFNYWDNGELYNLYGLPSGAPFVGSYVYDRTNGIIILDPQFQFPQIIAECLVSPVEGQEYYVPVQFREALIAWLWWKDKKAINVKRGAVGINRDLKEEFINARRNAKSQWNPFRVEDAYQSSLEQTRMSIKG